MPTPDSLKFLIVAVPAILIVIGIRRPLYAAIGYMVFVYCNASYYYPILAQFKAELVLAGIILARIMVDPASINRLSFKYNRINLYMLLFGLCIAISFVFAWNQKLSWDYAVYHFIKTFIIYCMVMMTLSSEKAVNVFAWSFVLMFVYLAYEPTYGYITKTGASTHMYGDIFIAEVGVLSGHVALANNMNQMIPIAFFLVLSFRKKSKKILALAAIPLLIFLISLIGSGSRGGVLGFLFFGLTLIFFSKQKLKTALIAGVVVVLLFLTSSMFSSTASRIDSGQTWGRFSGFTHGINFVGFGNVLGVGPGCFAIARGRYHGHSMDSHNLYGQIIGELGIPGTIVWFFLIRETFLNLARSKKLLKTLAMEKSFFFFLASGLQASLIVRLFISMASHGLYYFYWYILAAMSAALYFEVKRMANDTETLPELKAA